MQEIAIEITGISGLLMGAMSPEAQAQCAAGTSTRTAKKLTPREQAARREYRDVKTGLLYIPRENILASIRDAGTYGHKVGKKAVTTMKTSMVPAAVRIVESICILTPQEYELDFRRVVVPATQGAQIAVRPLFPKWSVNFTVLLEDRIFDDEMLRRLVDDAGRLVGLCDFRPARRGPFGCFVVTSWKLVK